MNEQPGVKLPSETNQHFTRITRRQFLISVGLGVALGLRGTIGRDPQIAAQAQGEAIMKRYAFLDTRKIWYLDNLEQRFHPATKRPEPVMVPERLWETQGIAARTVLYDGERFRLWYNPRPGARADEMPNMSTAYAESHDGLHWERPKLGLVEFQGSCDNNMVNFWGGCPSIIDDGEAAPPQERYHIIADWAPPEQRRRVQEAGRDFDGYHGAYSADGYSWTYYDDNPLIPGYDDTSCFVRDEPRHRYYAMIKQDSRIGLYDRRSICVGWTEDFLHWPELPLVLCPDELDDRMSQERGALFAEFYAMGLLPQQDFLVGFLEVFHPTGLYESQLPRYRLGLPGPIDVQLTFSYDGLYWQRSPGREPFIALGEPGSWDDGCILCRATAVEVGDEVWVYYTGVRGGHARWTEGMAIGLATIKQDRWASLSATGGEGWVEVGHGVPDGRELLLNVAARSGVTVEVRQGNYRGTEVQQGNKETTVVPGFERERCQPIVGDHLRAPVRWEDKGFADLNPRQPISLRFYLRDADLFAYAVQ